jgi:FkbM family methyltransferase
MTIATGIHGTLAGLLRTLPPFRGKGRLARYLHNWFLRKLVPSQAVRSVLMRDGSRMLLDLRSNTEWSAFYTGSYDDLLPTVLALLPERSLALDVGANVGFYTIPMGRRLKSLGGKCVAFEPVPANYARLRQNLQANGLDEVVQTVQMALGEANREITMLLDDNHGATTGNAARVPGADFNEGQLERRPVVARMMRLDDCVEELGLGDLPCRFIKVDIEGNEPHFFQGAARFLKLHRPLVLAEVNPVWLAWNQLGIEDYFATFESESYTFFSWQGNGWREVTRPKGQGTERPIDTLLMTPPGFPRTHLGIT